MLAGSGSNQLALRAVADQNSFIYTLTREARPFLNEDEAYLDKIIPSPLANARPGTWGGACVPYRYACIMLTLTISRRLRSGS